MINKLKLSYSMNLKREKIIKYKKKLDRVIKHLYIAYLCLFIIIASFIINNEHFRNSFTSPGEFLSNLRKVDYFLLVTSIIIVVYLFLLSGEYNLIKNKYEVLRHDIMKDLDYPLTHSKLCYCNNECECREKLIQEMDKYGIDLTFRKYKLEKKYL